MEDIQNCFLLLLLLITLFRCSSDYDQCDYQTHGVYNGAIEKTEVCRWEVAEPGFKVRPDFFQG